MRPLILVQTSPQAVDKDSSLIISARFYNRDTLQKQPVKKIYMNIISMKDGHEVWPNEVIRKNTWKFDIEISTKDMKVHEYLIRVSNNDNYSPMGSTTFKVKKSITVPLLLFPIPLIESPEDKITKRMIEKKIFITQMDARVCPFCIQASIGYSPGLKPSEYYPDDTNAPVIPVHFNCRCTYEIIFANEFEASFTDVIDVWSISQDIPLALQAVKTLVNNLQ